MIARSRRVPLDSRQHFVNALRDFLGLDPLYDCEPRTEAERFDRTFATSHATRHGGRMVQRAVQTE